MKKDEMQIITVEEANQLPKEVVTDLQSNFNPLFQQAQEWKKKAEGLVVKDASETEKMKEAREARLELKRIRVDADKVRKQLKEESLLKGKAIDGMYNIIKFLIQPIEQHLEEQEKFIEIQEEKRLNAIVEDRIERLSPYMEDLSIFNFRIMSDEQFNSLLDGAKRGHEAKLEAERKAEEERKQAEEQKKEEERRLAKTEFLESLINQYGLDRSIDVQGLMKLDKDEFDKKITEAENFIKAEVNKVKEENERLKKEREEQAKKEAKEAAERAEKERKEREAHEAKLREEREKREALEREIQAKKEAEEKAKAEEEKRKKQAAMAPDKDKLTAFASKLLSMEYPEMATEEGQKIILQTQELMKKVNKHIISSVEKL